MKGYWEAYAARLQRNEEQLLQLAKEVVAIDPEVKVYVSHLSKRYHSSITFVKGETINRIGFHEVPYRWSGCGYEEIGTGHPGGENSSMPFSAETVIETFKKITSEVKRHSRRKGPEHFKSIEDYFGHYTFHKELHYGTES